jgi:hypothetical protein
MASESDKAVGWKGPFDNQSSTMRIDTDVILERAFSRSQLRSIFLLRISNPEVSLKKLVAYILLNESDHHAESMLDRFGLEPPARMSLLEDAGMTNWERSVFIQAINQLGSKMPD